MSDTAFEPLLAQLPEPPRKVALLRASRLGDFVCTGPALRALRHVLPEAEFTMITVPRLHDAVVRSPYLDGFAPFPGFPGIAQQFFDARRALDFFRRMQAERFDLAIQMQGSGVYSNPFTLMLGARYTAGFIRPEDAPSRLDAALPWPTQGHEIRRLLALVRYLGALPRGEDLVFPLFPSDRAAAESLLAGLTPPLLGLHVGAHHPYRRWPLERFVAAAHALQHRHGGSVILLGGRELCDDARLLERRIPGSRNLVGQTPLGVLGAIVARLSLLITNDSGPAHLAFALKAPAVVIYRSGGTERYGPLADGPFAALEPETHGVNGDGPLVSLEQVLAAAGQLLNAQVSFSSTCSETDDAQYAS